LQFNDNHWILTRGASLQLGRRKGGKHQNELLK
jgi:hypothetical protein